MRDSVAMGQHSPFLPINWSVLCIVCILDFSDQKLWDCLGLLRMSVALKEWTNILETKLLAIRFKVSFNHACVLARIVSLKPCNNLHKPFCLQWAWSCLSENDWWMKGDKAQVFSSRSDYMEANRVKKQSIITICKYPQPESTVQISARELPFL